jgi:hypothetical protein
MTQTASALPDITALLVSKGRNTVGHETNLARSPLWNMRKRVAHVETVVSPDLYGHPFRQVAGSHLTTSDQYLFAYLTTMFLRAGCPDGRRVPFSLGDAVIALGYDDLGGKQRKLVRKSLARLGSVVLESAVRYPDGHETVIGWRLIDNYVITTRGGGRGWVGISDAVGELLASGSVTFLHAPTWRAIRDDDEVAGRLWSFLESESIGRGWRYPLFRSDREAAPRSLPSIAEVLQLDWSNRPKIAHRLREACRVIEAHDTRYRLTITTGRGEGSWILTCARGNPVSRTDPDVLPNAILKAWRQAFRSHLPSHRQEAVLKELLTRRSPEWIAAQLADAQGDPFRALLDADSGQSKAALQAARQEEEDWDVTKSRESAGAEQSLAELLAAVRSFR